MAESEIENNRIAKFQRWQETWRSRWKTEGPPDYELTPEGNIARAEWEREFLEVSRTPARAAASQSDHTRVFDRV